MVDNEIRAYPYKNSKRGWIFCLVFFGLMAFAYSDMAITIIKNTSVSNILSFNAPFDFYKNVFFAGFGIAGTAASLRVLFQKNIKRQITMDQNGITLFESLYTMKPVTIPYSRISKTGIVIIPFLAGYVIHYRQPDRNKDKKVYLYLKDFENEDDLYEIERLLKERTGTQ